MRWFWRGFLLIAIVYFLKTYTFPQPAAFISWPEGKSWAEKINFQVKRWQNITQGLPESLEVEVRRFLTDFRASGSGEEV